MSQNNRNYIARKYYAQNYGSQNIYEESIFESYESAYKYIEEISEEDHDRFLSEIVSYVINDTESWENEQTWTFDRKGKLVRFYDAQKKYENCRVIERDGYKEIYEEPKPKSYTGLFQIGDIVIVKAFPWNCDSPIPEDTLGVVANRPVLYNEWIEQGYDKYDWDNKYVIDFIRDGYMDHMHVEEHGVKKAEKKIPEKLSFLIRLSNHYNGKKPLKFEIFKDVIDGNIFVEKVRHFDENESVLT